MSAEQTGLSSNDHLLAVTKFLKMYLTVLIFKERMISVQCMGTQMGAQAGKGREEEDGLCGRQSPVMAAQGPVLPSPGPRPRLGSSLSSGSPTSSLWCVRSDRVSGRPSSCG